MIVSVLLAVLCALLLLRLLTRRGASVAINLFAILVCFTAMMWGYREIVAASFKYMGFAWEPSLLRISLAFCVVLLLGYFIPSRLSLPSVYFVQLWFLFAYLPIVVLFALGGFDAAYWLFATLCLGLMLLLRGSLPIIRTISVKEGPGLALFMLFALTIVTYTLLIQRLGFRFGFTLEGVYEVRDVYKNIGIRSLSYLTIWQGYVLNPILLGIGIQQKRPWLIGLTGLITIVLVSVTGIKSFLVGAVLVGMVIFLLRVSSRSKAFLSVGIGGLAAVSSIAHNLGFIWFSSLGFRRLLFTPALLNYRYFQFFSENPKAFLGYSIFSRFTDYRYDLPPSGIIARWYDPSASSGANAGFLADAYANFGFIGMLVFSIILVLVLRLIDSIALRRGVLFVLMPLAMPLFALINSALLTSLVTHGILFGIAMSWLLIPKHNPEEKMHSAQVSPPAPIILERS